MAIPDFQTLMLPRPRLAPLGKTDMYGQAARRRFSLVKFRSGEESK
jgi:hypothetical protein